MTTATTLAPVGTWTIDSVHSEIGYSVKHLGLAKSKGRFTTVGGTVTTAENLLDSSVTAEIDATSVDSGNGMRDDHLKSADFFDADNHPTITFRSTGIREDDDDYVIDGELTWRGVTVPVSLQAEWGGVGPNPANGNATTLGVSASTKVNRRDFGIGPEGHSFLSEQVTITLEIQAVLQA